MKGWFGVVSAIFANAGPLLVFYAVDWGWGLKPAIVACAVFAISQVAWRFWRKEPLTFLFKLTATTTVSLGLLDIFLASPTFFSYEASITNAAFGAWFAWMMVKGAGPFVDEVVKQSPQVLETVEGGRDGVEGLMRVLLAIVVAYHVVTAAAYLWIASRYTVEQAVGIRALFGTASLIPFLACVYFGLHPLHDWSKRRGWV